MEEFCFGFDDAFDFAWSFATEELREASSTFGRAPDPPQAPQPESPAPCHRRSRSANAAMTSDGVASPVHRRCGSAISVSLVQPNSDSEFAGICQDSLVTFNPKCLGFIPARNWEAREVTFGALVAGHFQKKSGSNTRFFHKLYNALKIAEFDPFYAEFVGVEWVSDRVIKIDKKKFARLLGIRAIDGSLFHQQGNFPSHGFREVGPLEAKEILSADELANVDYDAVRLLVHAPGDFMRSSPPQVFEKCRWINLRQQ
jgi:hypothetical protein